MSLFYLLSSASVPLKADDSSCQSIEELTQQIKQMRTINEKLQNEIKEMKQQMNMNRRYPIADFESEWFPMKSHDDVMSYKQVFHELNAVPSRVKVMVKVPEEDKYGDMAGMIFEGIGGQPMDDDTQGNWQGEHGGVLFAYDKHRVKLWAPNVNNGHRNGHIIRLGDGFGPKGMLSLIIDDAKVKVLVWK